MPNVLFAVYQKNVPFWSSRRSRAPHMSAIHPSSGAKPTSATCRVSAPSTSSISSRSGPPGLWTQEAAEGRERGLARVSQLLVNFFLS